MRKASEIQVYEVINLLIRSSWRLKNLADYIAECGFSDISSIFFGIDHLCKKFSMCETTVKKFFRVFKKYIKRQRRYKKTSLTFIHPAFLIAIKILEREGIWSKNRRQQMAWLKQLSIEDINVENATVRCRKRDRHYSLRDSERIPPPFEAKQASSQNSGGCFSMPNSLDDKFEYLKNAFSPEFQHILLQGAIGVGNGCIQGIKSIRKKSQGIYDKTKLGIHLIPRNMMREAKRMQSHFRS